MSFIFEIPQKLDVWLRRWDLQHGRIDNTWVHKWFVKDQSPMALWLPALLIVSLAYGVPFLLAALADILAPLFTGRGYDAPVWRGGWHLVLCLGVLGLHFLASSHRLEQRWPKAIRALLRPPHFQWLLILILVAGLWLLSNDNVAWSDRPYFHVFGPFALFVLALAVPARWWADWLIGRKCQRTRFRKAFARQLDATELFKAPPPNGGPGDGKDPAAESADRLPAGSAPAPKAPESPGPKPLRRLIRALILPLLSPIELILGPSLALLVATPGTVKLVLLVSLAIFWILLAAVHYNERLEYFLHFARQLFLVGWTRVVSILVVALAAARLAGVGYVTTVLDQASWTVIVGLALQFYLIFWLYDYWRERALAETLLGLLHKGKPTCCCRLGYDGPDPQADGNLQIHGAGRFIAIRPATEGSRYQDLGWDFESYQPLDVFRRIYRQLLGRARAGAADRRDAERVAQWLEALEEKVQIYTATPAIVIGLAVLAGGSWSLGLDQDAALEVAALDHSSVRSTAAAAPAADGQALCDLIPSLEDAAGRDLYAVAASGGGTRAALWTYEVLRELERRQALDRVVLLSGVSGGSAGVAYFAAYRDELLDRGDADPAAAARYSERWSRYRDAMAASYIHEVLSGVGEWRMVTGTRLGALLSESLRREFFGDIDEDRAFGDLAQRARADSETSSGSPDTSTRCRLGLIFNTAVTGSWDPDKDQAGPCVDDGRGEHECGTTLRAGSRLALTNLAWDAVADAPEVGWALGLDYQIAGDAETSLTTAAALSANFPPVFSNALVKVRTGTGTRRFWVTDGGAMENRGLISLLLALKAELAEAQGPIDAAHERAAAAAETAGEARPVKPTRNLAPLKIVVAEASGLSKPLYKEDRGLGAASGGKAKIASRLLLELVRDVNAAYKELSGKGIEIIYLPMPTALRRAFGTHWQMPRSIWLNDPDDWWKQDPPEIELDTGEILAILDLAFSDAQTRHAMSLEHGDPVTLWKWLDKDWTEPVKRLDDLVPREPM